jgi:hypothetical protein
VKNTTLYLNLFTGLMLAAFLPAAQGDTIFSLNQSGCCGTGPFGNVTLSQVNATTVHVLETLNSGNQFVRTGAGEALEFNVSGTIAISNLTAGFATGVGGDTAPPFGVFISFVDCSGCGPGASSPLPGPLSFDVTRAAGLLITDFTANSGGYYFASDIIAGTGGPTGNVAANSFTTTAVPEPVSLSFVGVALFGLGLLRRRLAA